MSILRNLDIEAYHLHSAQSASKISYFINEGPLAFKGCYIDGTIPRKDTKDLKRGRLFDELMTEPTKVEAVYVMQPDTYPADNGEQKPWHNGAKYCKAFNEQTEANGLIAIPEKEWNLVAEMRECVLEHPIARQLIECCEPQLTVRRKMPALGFELQTRPDGVATKGCAASGGRKFRIDFKKTSKWGDWHNVFEPTSRNIGRSVTTYGYHRQAAIADCLFSLEPEYGPDMPHYLIVVEDAPPHRVGVFELSDSFLESGWKETERAMSALAECYRTKVWPGSPSGIVTLEPPRWLDAREDRIEETSVAAAGRA